MAVNKFCIHFLYLSEKRLSLKACIFGSKQMAFVYLAFFDDGTAFPYLPVLSHDFFFGADTLPVSSKNTLREATFTSGSGSSFLSLKIRWI